MTTRKLVRSRDHRIIAGVCGGLADYFNLDPALVRLVAIVASFFSAGLVAGAYLVAWLIIPDEGSGDTGADQLYDKYGEYRRRRDAREGAAPSDDFSAD